MNTNAKRELPDAERFLTKTELAKRLGVRPRTVSVWVQQSRLPVYRVGRYLRFKWIEVEQHLAATCRTPGEGRPT